MLAPQEVLIRDMWMQM